MNALIVAAILGLTTASTVPPLKISGPDNHTTIIQQSPCVYNVGCNGCGSGPWQFARNSDEQGCPGQPWFFHADGFSCFTTFDVFCANPVAAFQDQFTLQNGESRNRTYPNDPECMGLFVSFTSNCGSNYWDIVIGQGTGTDDD
jgi:hypothetical protein